MENFPFLNFRLRARVPSLLSEEFIQLSNLFKFVPKYFSLNEYSFILERDIFFEILRNSNEFIEMVKIEILLIGLHLAEFAFTKIIFSWKKLSLVFSRKWLRMFIKLFDIFPDFSLDKTRLLEESNAISEEIMMNFLPAERLNHLLTPFHTFLADVSGTWVCTSLYRNLLNGWKRSELTLPACRDLNFVH